jgi:hypothetical protein
MSSNTPKKGRTRRFFKRLGDEMKEVFRSPSPSPSARDANERSHTPSIEPSLNDPSASVLSSNQPSSSHPTQMSHIPLPQATVTNLATSVLSPPPQPSVLIPDPVTQSLSTGSADTTLAVSTPNPNQVLSLDTTQPPVPGPVLDLPFTSPLSPPNPPTSDPDPPTQMSLSEPPIMPSSTDKAASEPVLKSKQPSSTSPGVLQTTKDLASIGLRTSLQVLKKNANIFPPLKSAIDILIECIDVFPVSTSTSVVSEGVHFFESRKPPSVVKTMRYSRLTLQWPSTASRST